MKRALQICGSLLLAVFILYWIYRDFPFETVSKTLSDELKWQWLALAAVFGVVPQIVRGLRWKLALEPLGFKCRQSNLIYSVFVSFATSLIIPRIGEVFRCVSIKQTDKVPFSSSFGTVVTERIVDTLVLAALITATFFCESSAISEMFDSAGVNLSTITAKLGSNALLIITAIGILLLATIILFIKRLSKKNKIRTTLHKFKEGLLSIRNIRRIWLYLGYSLLICLCNFLNFWLTFYAFDFTSGLNIGAALLAFSFISFAVILPTPNGAGPWHFAVKVVLVTFGVAANDAILFALIVHAFQVLIVILLGLFGMTMLRKTGSISEKV